MGSVLQLIDGFAFQNRYYRTREWLAAFVAAGVPEGDVPINPNAVRALVASLNGPPAPTNWPAGYTLFATIQDLETALPAAGLNPAVASFAWVIRSASWTNTAFGWVAAPVLGLALSTLNNPWFLVPYSVPLATEEMATWPGSLTDNVVDPPRALTFGTSLVPLTIGGTAGRDYGWFQTFPLGTLASGFGPSFARAGSYREPGAVDSPFASWSNVGGGVVGVDFTLTPDANGVDTVAAINPGQLWAQTDPAYAPFNPVGGLAQCKLEVSSPAPAPAIGLGLLWRLESAAAPGTGWEVLATGDGALWQLTINAVPLPAVPPTAALEIILSATANTVTVHADHSTAPVGPSIPLPAAVPLVGPAMALAVPPAASIAAPRIGVCTGLV